MKSLLKRIALACACLTCSLSSSSQTKENFDSRPAVHAGAVLNYLEDRCWQFSNLSVVSADESALHGDGALVSVAGTLSSNLYTPVLDLWSGCSFSFSYAFDATSTWSRSITIYLVNANNEIVSLCDNIDVTGAAANTVYTYSKTLAPVSNAYKLHISYRGGGSKVRIQLDDLAISANQRYKNGCNDAPIAVNDVINGSMNREASGSIVENDRDPNAEAFNCYLVSNSPDGTVKLNANGTFSFTPKPGFTGNTTSFTYRACDLGYNQLCSEETTVLLKFANEHPAEITELQANHHNNRVTLKWNTMSETRVGNFEIERSTDGNYFEKAGEVEAKETSTTVKQLYSFDDRVAEKTSRKNDLYYRLKQIDANGKAVYSKTLLVRVFKTKTLQAVSVTPNPAVNNIKVHLQLNEPAYVVIKLRSTKGEELTRSTLKAFQGDNNFALEGSEKVKKGMYMMEVIVNSNERMVVKLLKN